MMLPKFWMSGYLITFISRTSFCLATMDNSITGTPRLGCLDDSLEFSFNTERQFNGRLYTKGRADDADCRQDFFNANNPTSTVVYYVKMGRCGMSRMRSVDPAGLHVIIVIIVSFHPIFETRFDRAFRLQCLFRPLPPQMVTQSLDVSNIPTTSLTSTAATGSCSYTVRRDSVDGPPMRFAVVGDVAMHVWECEGSSFMHSLLVHSCYTSDDGAKIMVPIVDERGCTMDPLLLESVQYDTHAIGVDHGHPSLRAYAASRVYKYSDQNTISFTCNVRLCVKVSGECEGISFQPPTCPLQNPSDPPYRTQRKVRADDRRQRNLAFKILTRDEMENSTSEAVLDQMWPEPPVFNQEARQDTGFRNLDVSTGDIFVLPKDALVDRDGDAPSNHALQFSSSDQPLLQHLLFSDRPRSELSSTPPQYSVISKISPFTNSSNNRSHPSTNHSLVSSYSLLSLNFDPFQQDQSQPGGICIPPLTYAVMVSSTLLAMVAFSLFSFWRLAKTIGYLWSMGKKRKSRTDQSISAGRPFGQMRTPPVIALYPATVTTPMYASNACSYSRQVPCDNGHRMSASAEGQQSSRKPACPREPRTVVSSLLL